MKYRDWQVLAYEGAIDKQLFTKERDLYLEWLNHQPAAVERPTYSIPLDILTRQVPSTCSDRLDLTGGDGSEQGDTEGQ